MKFALPNKQNASTYKWASFGDQHTVTNFLSLDSSDANFCVNCYYIIGLFPETNSYLTFVSTTNT